METNQPNNLKIQFQEGNIYHIFNQGNRGINIFYQERNYFHFLKKYDEYLSDFIETYAYCLLPNHFHLLMKIKSQKDFPLLKHTENKSVDEIISEQFRRFFMAYAKAINVQEKLTGSLFRKRFERKWIDSDVYFTQMIGYVHCQLSHHGFSIKDQDYDWSSYKRILTDTPSKLQKQAVLDWFGTKEKYIEFHKNYQIDFNNFLDLKDLEDL
jgi:putative transposase